MKTMIIDLNTIEGENLMGISSLQKTDKAILLYSDETTISIDLHIVLKDAKCIIEYQKANISGDMGYGFLIGKMVAENKNLILIDPPKGIVEMGQSLGIKIQHSIKENGGLNKKPSAKKMAAGSAKEKSAKAMEKESKVPEKVPTEKPRTRKRTKVAETTDSDVEGKIKNICFHAGQRTGKPIITAATKVKDAAITAKGNKKLFLEALSAQVGESKAKQIYETLEQDLNEILSICK